MEMIPMSTQIRTKSHVRAMTEAQGAVLLDLREGRYFSINPVGAEIWQQLEQGAERESIVEHLRGTFNAPAEQLSQDVDGFVELLSQRGLIDVHP
jgi:hypothetical protein